LPKRLVNKKFLQEQAIKLYTEEFLSLNQVAEVLNISQRQVFRFVKGKTRSIVESRRITSKVKNLDFFDNIDSEEKAYFLGLIYSDGCLHENRGVTISLEITDKHLIEKFSSIFNSNITYETTSNGSIHCQTSIWSVYITRSLEKVGIYPRKSSLKDVDILNNLPKHLLRHFIRGFLDGDGCIYESRKDTYGVTLSGNNENFIFKLAEEIKDNCDFNYLRISKNCKCNCRSITIHGNLKSKVFLDWLYKDSSIFMYRKKAIYEKIVVQVNNKKFTGVRFDKRNGKFRAVLGYEGKRTYSKFCISEQQAAELYDKMATKQNYERYQLNFPERYEEYLKKIIPIYSKEKGGPHATLEMHQVSP